MFQLNMSKLNNNNNIRLKIEIEEFNQSKGISVLGEVEMTLQQLMENVGKQFKMNKNSLFVGWLNIIDARKLTKFTFLDYI